ncbi:mucin-4-like [Drosophila albomicans]|uniref:Mucin-4-like n=1 Tax=Drosophila albomicans TaxID=7291 RepID=A0A9C6T358_DROAB|nr:mucin-4-like [Drosophila albomicans]
MTMWLLLTFCVLAGSVSSMSIGDRAGRINGVNGWYVPSVDGGLKWMSMQDANQQLAAYETLNDLEIVERISLNAVTFYLYTLNNPNDGQVIKASKDSIDSSNFNPEFPTRITIHGWNSNYKDGVNTGVRAAWFRSGNYNMIAVDWSRGRSLEYASSVAAAASAGGKVSTLIDYLVKQYGMSLDTLEIVGFSLGAHVAGHAAKQVTTGTVQKVVGLDPAMPLMSYDKPAKRLSSNDAYYVETIQTNGGTLGYTRPIGRAVFYPNGGKSQPGCGLDLTGSCSHTRAVSYYVEALTIDNYLSISCPSYEYANKKDCCGSSVQNIFYVPVNKESPYGYGEVDGDDSTTKAPEEPTTTDPENETEADTTTAPEDGETTPSPSSDSTTTTTEAAETSTSSSATTEDETEADTTTIEPEAGETTVSPGNDSTTEGTEASTSSSATTEETEADTTTITPEGGETTASPPNDSTTEGTETSISSSGTTEDETEADTTTIAPEDGETTASPPNDSTTEETETSAPTSAPTTIMTEDGETTVSPGNDSTTSTTEGIETPATPSPPSEDDKGKGNITNIYILNLIFVNANVNTKPELN